MGSKKKKSSARTPALHSKNPLVAKIESRWRRTGESLSIERIASELDDVARYDIVAALKELEKAGAGEFFVGHAGLKSRFVWATTPARVEAGGKPVKPKAGTRTPARSAAVASESASKKRAAVDLPGLEHRFHLRPGFIASIQLPVDVTRTEVERFCQFLQAIPFGRDDSSENDDF